MIHSLDLVDSEQLFANNNIFYAVFIWCYYFIENELNRVDKIIQVIFDVGPVFFAIHISAVQCAKLAFDFLDLFD